MARASYCYAAAAEAPCAPPYLCMHNVVSRVHELKLAIACGGGSSLDIGYVLSDHFHSYKG